MKFEAHSHNGLPPWTVKLDGEDVADQIRSFSFKATLDTVAAIDLEMYARDGLSVAVDDADANVTLVTECNGKCSPQLPLSEIVAALPDDLLDALAYTIWDLYQFSDAWADWDKSDRVTLMRDEAKSWETRPQEYDETP